MQLRIGKFAMNLSFRGEKRSMSSAYWSEQWARLFGEENSSGETVNESTALRVSTVSACIKILGEDIAALPKAVMKTEGQVRKKDTKNRLHYLMSVRPNKHMTAYNWTFAMVAGAAGWGESYAPITRHKGTGDVLEIGLVPPWEMYRVPMPDGSMYYKEVHTGKVWNADDIITLRPFTLDGKKPVSIIRYNAETIGFALQSQKYRGKVFKIKPPGYLASDHNIVVDQLKQIGQYWSGQMSSGVPIAYGGMKYMPISFNPAELQLLETNKLTEQQICSLFRVPPTFLQDYNRATFANAEQQGLIYKTYTLQPFITNFMQEIDAKCFPESNQRSETPNYINFNLNGLLAGDYKTRTEGYRSLFQMGVPLNHFMALEDQNPVDGGDVGYVPMNMIRVDKAEAFADKLIATTGSKEKAGERSLADILTEHGIKLQTNGHEHV
jgi:HK97 family phage portal protein